jgi:hypothetical protein
MPGLKRQPRVGKQGRRLHEKWSKSTIHEALLDMWMETNGRDVSPDDMTDAEWEEYEADIERRSALRQGRG